jgi:hypothetical protein
MRKKWLVVILFSICTITVYSQEKGMVDGIIDKALNDENTYADIEQYINSVDSIDKLWDIESKLNASQAQIRYLLYNILNRIGLQAQSNELRSRVVYLLVNRGLNDDDPGNSGRCIEYLTEFRESDFDAQTRNQLGAIVMNSKGHVTDLIRLSGQIKLTTMVPVFEEKLKTTKNKKEEWLLRCALARMGDPEQQNFCLNRLKNLGFNDQVILYIVPDVIYTQSKDAFNFLLNSILTDQMHCTSFDPDSSEKINCAFRLIEMVAPYVVDFPVALSASGDLGVNDYNQALTVVRQWITDNMATYQLQF